MSRRHRKETATEAFESALAAAPDRERYVLRLYVTGMTPRSVEAFTTIKTICEEHLQGSYELEVIDIYEHPMLVRDEQILAVPTLVKKLPLPLRRLIGNLSDEERVLIGLDLRREAEDRVGHEGKEPS
jgi:circadian clock protein KaiB